MEKNLAEQRSNKPQRLLEEAPPEIRDYVLALERRLADVLPFKHHYEVINKKYLDGQEDLFALKIEISECKYKLEQLTKDNDNLKEAAKQNKSNVVPPKENVPTCTIRGALEQSLNELIDPNENANSILLKGVPEALFRSNPKKGVILLGQYMNLQLTEIDIRKITAKERKFYERQNMQPDKLIFIVELSNSDTKVNILKNKEKLKLHPKAKDIEITDFVSEDVYNLYQYAKVLKSSGYHLVYWRNNSVYAKRTRSSNSQPILIKSTNQVDVLKEIK